MNRIIATLAIAIVMTTAVTAYAAGSGRMVVGIMYPPVVCADSETVKKSDEIVVKFKIAELYDTLKKSIFNAD